MTTREHPPATAPARARGGVERTVGRRARLLVGGFYLSMGGVHVGIVAADPQLYRHFADSALLGFVRSGWSEVFMAAPAVWGLCLALGETVLGVLLLTGGRPARLGWAGVIAFQVLLMLFGWGVWLWSIPALAVLVPCAVADWPALGRRHSGQDLT